jgi:hypothetical protein
MFDDLHLTPCLSIGFSPHAQAPQKFEIGPRPPQATIPTLREAAVRLQADLLLVFRLTSDIYYQPRLFARDQIRAYCTCEAVLLDVRTGLVPFTAITTRDRLEKKAKQDLDINETMRRAETAAVLDSLRTASDKLTDFLQSPTRSTP